MSSVPNRSKPEAIDKSQSYLFPRIALRPPSLQKSLSHLANQLSHLAKNNEPSPTSFSLLNSRELAHKCLYNSADLSPFELMRLIYARADELNLNGKERFELSLKLWRQAIAVPHQYSSMISLVANQTLLTEDTLSGESWLKVGFDSLGIQDINRCPNKPLRELLISLKTQIPQLQVMRNAYQAQQTPWRWLSERFVTLQPEAMKYLIPLTVKALEPISQLTAKDAIWLRSCLVHAQENEYLKVILAQELLIALPTKVDHQVGLKPLVRWFQLHFKRGSSSWERLTPEAKTRLSGWLGELTYQDFSQLITKVTHLLKQRLVYAKKMEIEINRLQKRRDFWQAYKGSFRDMRVLFPLETLKLLQGTADDLLNVCEVEVLGPGEQVEVCLFEVQAYIIVEVFRGNVTEIFVFDNDQKTKTILFGEEIGLDKLRADSRLRSLIIFDHLYCWQGEVQRWLYSKGLPTDPGVTHIKGTPSHTRFVHGVTPQPNPKDKAQRLKQVNSWSAKRAKLVEEAKESLRLTY